MHVNVIGKYQAGITKRIDSMLTSLQVGWICLTSCIDRWQILLKTKLLPTQASTLKHSEFLRRSPTIIHCSNLNDLLDLQKEFDPGPKLEQAKANSRRRLDLRWARPLCASTPIAPGATDCACFKAFKKSLWRPLVFSPTDFARCFTLAYVLARLEDEEGLHKLDEGCGYQSNAWMRLAFTLLFLGWIACPQASRKGCQPRQERHMLLRPSFVDLYIPCRIHFHTWHEKRYRSSRRPRRLSPTCREFISWAESVPGVTQEALVTTRLKPD